MDIAVKFTQPELITQSASEPDSVVVLFEKSGMFMDK